MRELVRPFWRYAPRQQAAKFHVKLVGAAPARRARSTSPLSSTPRTGPSLNHPANEAEYRVFASLAQIGVDGIAVDDEPEKPREPKGDH
jgi:hypothetical protein